MAGAVNSVTLDAAQSLPMGLRYLSISPGLVNTNFQGASNPPPDFLARAVSHCIRLALNEGHCVAKDMPGQTA